jgi:hypothetical protein
VYKTSYLCFGLPNLRSMEDPELEVLDAVGLLAGGANGDCKTPLNRRSEDLSVVTCLSLLAPHVSMFCGCTLDIIKDRTLPFIHVR